MKNYFIQIKGFENTELILVWNIEYKNILIVRNSHSYRFYTDITNSQRWSRR